MSPQLDVSLVELAMRGSEKAFSRLVEQQYPMVFGLAYGVVRNRNAAEDLAQDAFLVAWRNLEKLRSAPAFAMWLRRITRNLALNWVRSEQYRRALAERHAPADAEPRFEQAEQEQKMAQQERSQMIRAGLETLRPKVREAIILFYLEGQSVSEAAAALGITEGAMKLRLLKGRRQLKKHFAERWEEELKNELLNIAPSDARTRIASGLAAGPVLPALGERTSGSGLGLWLHQIYHGGPSSVASALVKGGVVMSTQKAGSIAALVLLIGLAGLFGAQRLLKGGGPSPDDRPRIDYADVVVKEENEADQSGDALATPPPVVEPNESATPDTTSDEDAPQGDAVDDSHGQTERGKITDPEKYAAISGTVVDLKGNPIVGASVVVSASGFEDLNFSSPDLDVKEFMRAMRDPEHLSFAETGPGGLYAIQGIRYEGVANVRAAAPGYSQPRKGGSESMIRLHPGDDLKDVDILLSPGVTLEGHVVTQAEEPVTDALVSVLGFTTGDSTTSGFSTVSRTDEKGWFQLSFEEPSRAAINVSSTRHGQASFMEIEVHEGSYAKLVMPPLSTVYGKITWADQSPAVGTQVVLEGGWYDAARHSSGRLEMGNDTSSVVDENGEYIIRNVDPGLRYLVRIYESKGKALTPPLPFGDIEPGDAVEWNHTIADPIVVRGRVLGEVSGQPLTDVKVAALKDGEKLLDTGAIVGADGTYELILLAGAGSYHVYPTYWRLDPIQEGYDVGETVELTPGDEYHLDLRLRDTFSMSFQVVDLAGNPIENLMISVRDPGHTWGPAGYTDAEGRWSWSGFISGIETGVVVHTNGRQRVRSTPVVGEPLEVLPEEVLVLHEYGGVEGVMLDAAGAPIANATVRVDVLYGFGKQTQFTINTDETGGFVVLDQIPATAVQVQMTITAGPGHLPLPLTWQSESFNVPADHIVNLGEVVFAGADANAP